MEIIKRRKSIRNFKDVPVEEEKIKEIVDCARLV